MVVQRNTQIRPLNQAQCGTHRMMVCIRFVVKLLVASSGQLRPQFILNLGDQNATGTTDSTLNFL